jgi:hypothetical protein
MSNSFPATSRPAWAVDVVKQALQQGKSVHEACKLLTDKGMPSADADHLVMTLIEERVGRQSASARTSESQEFYHRAASALVGGLTVIFGFLNGGVFRAGMVAFSVALPVACIWKADNLTSFWDSTMSTSPVYVIRYLAWFVLILLFLYRLEVVLVVH